LCPRGKSGSRCQVVGIVADPTRRSVLAVPLVISNLLTDEADLQKLSRLLLQNIPHEVSGAPVCVFQPVAVEQWSSWNVVSWLLWPDELGSCLLHISFVDDVNPRVLAESVWSLREGVLDVKFFLEGLVVRLARHLLEACI
ncbi:hypothetical protein PMAYCL1PPCAC_13307, partial [Pristionchus mayeri]